MCLDIWFVVRVRIAAEKWLEWGWWSGGRSHGVLLGGWGAPCPFCRDWSWTCFPYRLLKFYQSAISNLGDGFMGISDFLLSTPFNFLSPIFGSDRWPLKSSFPMFLGQLLKREVSLFDSQCVWIEVLNKTWNQSFSACQRSWMFDWQRTDKHKKTNSC